MLLAIFPSAELVCVVMPKLMSLGVEKLIEAALTVLELTEEPVIGMIGICPITEPVTVFEFEIELEVVDPEVWVGLVETGGR